MDARIRKAFEDIADEAFKAFVLLEGMLTLPRADSGSFGGVLEPVDLAEVVKEACAMARPVAETRGLLLTVSYSESTQVLGDFSSLRRMLWVLLDNALKYTDPPGRIEVTLSLISGQISVMVRDSGIGIAPTDLPYIFDRFYRADPSRS